jgi:cytochrome P450
MVGFRYHSGIKEPTLVNSPDPAYHAHLRKMLAPGFSEASLRKQETVIQEYIRMLMQRLEELGSSDEGVDLVMWFNVSIQKPIQGLQS